MSSPKDHSGADGAAEEVAARPVDEEWALSKEGKQEGTSPTQDMPPAEGGDKRSGKPPGGRTKQRLHKVAVEENVKGRCDVGRDEVVTAVGR